MSLCFRLVLLYLFVNEANVYLLLPNIMKFVTGAAVCHFTQQFAGFIAWNNVTGIDRSQAPK